MPYESLPLREIRKSRLLIADAFEICDSFVYVVISRRIVTGVKQPSQIDLR